MLRPNRFLAVAALVTALGPAINGLASASPHQASPVDVMTFMKAFQAGDAKRYVGALVQGAGQNFHGMGAARSVPGTPQAYVQYVTLGMLGTDGKTIEPLTSLEQFRAADKDSKTVVLQLTGPEVPRGAASNLPQKIEFSGVYGGKGQWASRMPPNDKTEALNPGNVCDGTPPVSRFMSGMRASTATTIAAHYCVPILTDAKVK